MSKKSSIILIVAVVIIVGVVYLVSLSSKQPGANTSQDGQKSDEIKSDNPEKNWKTTIEISDNGQYINERFHFKLSNLNKWNGGFEQPLKTDGTFQDLALVSLGTDNDLTNLSILPLGEYGHGLPFVTPIKSRIVLDNVDALITTFYDEKEFYYAIVEFDKVIPKNWNKENRIELRSTTPDGKKSLLKVINSIEFVF